MEDWAAIAAEVAGAIASVGFAATLRRAPIKQATPWDAPVDIAGEVFAVTVVDDGIKTMFDRATLITRQARVLTISATGVVPAMDDLLEVRGVEHRVVAVMPLAPGGVDLLFEVEILA